MHPAGAERRYCSFDCGTGRKGQTIAIEQVVVFVAGVSIFLIFLAVFQAYQSGYSGVAKRDVLEAVGNQIMGEMARLHGDGRTELAIPREAGGEEYEMVLTNDGLRVAGLVSGEAVVQPVRALRDAGLELEGEAVSLRGRLAINRAGNKIILGQ